MTLYPRPTLSAIPESGYLQRTSRHPLCAMSGHWLLDLQSVVMTRAPFARTPAVSYQATCRGYSPA